MGAQIHLLLNHVPVIGVWFAAAALMAGVVWRQPAITRLGVATLLAIAVVAIPVFLTGEPAEESIEHAAGVSERLIDSHQDLARVAMIGLGMLGLAALVALIRYRRGPIARGVASGLLVATLALGGVLAATAHRGGLIRHPELRADTAPAATEDEAR